MRYATRGVFVDENTFLWIRKMEGVRSFPHVRLRRRLPLPSLLEPAPTFREKIKQGVALPFLKKSDLFYSSAMISDTHCTCSPNLSIVLTWLPCEYSSNKNYGVFLPRIFSKKTSAISCSVISICSVTGRDQPMI